MERPDRDDEVRTGSLYEVRTAIPWIPEDSSIVVISSTYSLSHSLPFIESAVIVRTFITSHHTKLHSGDDHDGVPPKHGGQVDLVVEDVEGVFIQVAASCQSVSLQQ